MVIIFAPLTYNDTALAMVIIFAPLTYNDTALAMVIIFAPLTYNDTALAMVIIFAPLTLSYLQWHCSSYGHHLCSTYTVLLTMTLL